MGPDTLILAEWVGSRIGEPGYQRVPALTLGVAVSQSRSMIRYTQGNLLKYDAEALVDAVKTVGLIGTGIALAFKKALPEIYCRNADACKRGSLAGAWHHTCVAPYLHRSGVAPSKPEVEYGAASKESLRP